MEIIIFVITIILTVIYIGIQAYKNNNISEVIPVIFGVLLTFEIFNIVDTFNPRQLYNASNTNIIVYKLNKINENEVKCICVVIDNENVVVGKPIRFIDEVGKYNVGDTLTINRK